MDELIRQIRLAAASGLYYLALYGALTLPDICGALASDNGWANEQKYKGWIRDFVPNQTSDVDLIYGLRCSLLHQGRAAPHGSSVPMAFMFPAPGMLRVHRAVTESRGQEIYWYSIPNFVDEVTTAAELWLDAFGTAPNIVRNLEEFAQLRPNGIPGHIVGGPVIA